MSKKTLLGYLFIGMLLNGGFASCERQEMQNSARIELLDNSWNMNYPVTQCGQNWVLSRKPTHCLPLRR